VGSTVLGALIMALFLTDIPVPKTTGESACARMRHVVSLVIRSRDLKLLLIPSMTAGTLVSFIIGDFSAVSSQQTMFGHVEICISVYIISF